jgi:membrane-bound lytic murein transglycosylase D
LGICWLGLVALFLTSCGHPASDSAIGRQANLVAREGRGGGGQKYYRLGPRFEKQLSKMVNMEYLAIAGRKEEVPLELNQEVLIHLNYFLNDARGFMTRSLNRGQKYIPIMKAILKQKGLPEDLVYLALIESGFRTEAVSVASAVGPWQFIAATGRRYGLAINDWVDERMDPIKSTYAAADYLIALYEMFNSWPLAIAAYNSGEGKIMRGMAKPDVDNYWDMAKEDGFLANETKRYVPSFLAAAIIAKDPLAYGLEVESSQVDTWDEVVVPEPIDLAMAAQLSGSSLERLKELNPQLKRLATPPSERDFVLRVPQGSSDGFYQLYAQLPEAQRSSRMVIHVAKRGETVDSVANRYNLTTEVVRQYNNLSSARLSPGLRLVLPVSMAQAPGSPEPIQVATSSTSSSSARSPRRLEVSPQPALGERRLASATVAPEPQAQYQVSTPVRAQVAPARSGRVPVIATVRHRVRTGDTLGDLARHYGSTVEKLRSDNKLSSNNLREGQVLVVSSNLPVPASAPSRSKSTWVEETEGEPIYHTVQAGETLGAIAASRGATASGLMELNSLANSTIRPGQRLKIGVGPVTSSKTGSGVYVVKVGDTVSQIAERHNLTWQKLRELNNLSDNQMIRPGQELRVATAEPQPTQRNSRAVSRDYEVKPGDTVSQIAERHHMTAEELRSLNRLKGDRIVQGQKLKVWEVVPVAARVSRATSDVEFYVVVPGDTVATIAARHGLTSAELRRLNDLASDRIRSGQKLRVTATQPAPANSATQPVAQARASSSVFYVVVPGDTVSQIAERHNMTSAELRALNDLTGNQLRIGQKLKVTPSPTAPAARPTQPAAPAQATASASTAPAARPAQPVAPAQATASAPTAAASSADFYVVEVGDSVELVAAYFDLTPSELRRLNNLKNDKLTPGSKLRVQAPASSAPARSPLAAAAGLYEVAPGDTVSQIAERHNLTAAELRALNNLAGDQIRVGQKLKVAATARSTSSSTAASPTSSSPTRASASGGLYEVAPGDTVSQIAERHNLTAAELRALNNLTGDQIRVGQKLKVAATARSTSTSPTTSSPAQANSKEGLYEVVPGDTVSQIAARHNLTSAELRAWNNLTGDQIRTGQKLKVKAPATGSSQSSRSTASASGSGRGAYQVVDGDTMYSIARAHNLTVDELKKINGKKNNDIRPGQTLRVK